MTMTKLSTAVAHALALRQLPDLAPCEQVNHTLAQLVNAVVDPASEHEAFEANTTKEIQQIAAEAEGEMELKWSQRIAAADLPQQETEHFIYWDNYVKLTAHEVGLLKQAGFNERDVRRILVVGSGPLPMSAIHLRQHFPSATIDHVDSDPTAVTTGRRFLEAVGVTDDMYLCADGSDVRLTQMYDIVLIAALAGETVAQKQAIIDNVVPHLSNHGRILVRSARGVRGLLYPVFAASEIKRVQLRGEHHPTDDTINSAFVYAKEENA